MLVATEPYGTSEFEYPDVVLNPFKTSYVAVIPQKPEDEESVENDDNTNNTVIQIPSSSQTEVNMDTTDKPVTTSTPPAARPKLVKPSELLKSVNTQSSPNAPIELKDSKPSQGFAPIPINTITIPEQQNGNN